MSSPLGGMRGGAIPGGESTAMMRIMKDEGLFEPLRKAILDGLPVLGTCAGLIMLDRNHLGVMDITSRRNAYGRQLGSFHTEGDFATLGRVPMSFIRAPSIERVGNGVTVLSEFNGKPTAVLQGKQLALAYHPELLSDHRILQWFLNEIGDSRS